MARTYIYGRKCSVEGCGRKHDAQGYCSTHRQRWKRYGDPLADPKFADDGAPARFIERVAFNCKSDDCLFWPYSCDNHGYAQIAGKQRRVHRIVCIAVHGKPPTPKHEAAHTCGNGHLGCINPNHLTWKTHAENQRDMLAHDSWRNQYRRP